MAAYPHIRDVLRPHWVTLPANITLTDLFKGVLTTTGLVALNYQYLFETSATRHTETDCIREILQHITRRGPHALDNFVQCLRVSGMDYAADLLDPHHRFLPSETLLKEAEEFKAAELKKQKATSEVQPKPAGYEDMAALSRVNYIELASAIDIDNLVNRLLVIGILDNLDKDILAQLIDPVQKMRTIIYTVMGKSVNQNDFSMCTRTIKFIDVALSCQN